MTKKNKKAKKKSAGDNTNKPISSRGYLLKINWMHTVAILICFTAVTFWIYSETLHYPFHFDDETHIVHNPNIKITEFSLDQIVKVVTGISKQRPIAMISFGLNYFFGGFNTFGYHIINIIIHLINGMFLYLFTRNTLNFITPKNATYLFCDESRFNLISFFSVLIWLSHPLHTSSVTLIVQRMNSMAAMFFLLSILLYIKARKIMINQPKHKAAKLYLWGTLLSGLFALGCKEISITLPFFIFLYEYYFFQDLNPEWLKKYVLKILTLFVLFFLIFMLYLDYNPLKLIIDEYKLRDFTMSQRVLTEMRVIIFYLGLIFYPTPSRLNLDYDFQLSLSFINPFTTILSLASVIFLLLTALSMAKKEKLLSFAILWFLGNLAIESSIIPLEIIYEHRTYIPSLLLPAIFVAFSYRFLKLRKFTTSLLVILSAFLCFWCIDKNNLFNDPVTLWRDIVNKSPAKYRPHTNLGRSLAETDKTKEAIIEYSKALKINPDSAVTHYDIGVLYYDTGKIYKAITHYKQSIEINPNFAEAHNNLGVCYIDLKSFEKGMHHYLAATILDPDHPDARGNFNKANEGLKDIDRKIAKTILELKNKPKDLYLLKRLASLYYVKGEFGKALENYMNIFSVTPDDSSICYNIACLYALKNNKKESVKWLKMAIKKGYNNFQHMISDKDLTLIRETKYYNQLIDSGKSY